MGIASYWLICFWGACSCIVPQRVGQRTSKNGFGIRVVILEGKVFFLKSVSYFIVLFGGKGAVSYFVQFPQDPSPYCKIFVSSKVGYNLAGHNLVITQLQTSAHLDNTPIPPPLID